MAGLADQLSGAEAADAFSGVVVVRRGKDRLLELALGPASRRWPVANRLPRPRRLDPRLRRPRRHDDLPRGHLAAPIEPHLRDRRRRGRGSGDDAGRTIWWGKDAINAGASGIVRHDPEPNVDLVVLSSSEKRAWRPIEWADEAILALDSS